MKAAILTLSLALSACGAPPATVDAGPDLAAPIDLASGDFAFVPTGPALLSQTGLYADFATRRLVAGAFIYEVRYPLWADGAEKRRILLLPPGAQIDTHDMDNWVFPVGTKIWKEFIVAGRLVETRFLHKLQDGANGWWMSAYLWRLDGSDADATVLGLENAARTTHDVPSQEYCHRCHDNVRDAIIGVSAIQLSAADGHGTLSALAQSGVLTNPPAGEFEAPGAGIVKETLGYFHGNCGHCHNDGSTIVSQTVLRLRLRVSDQVPDLTPAYTTSINVKMYHLLNGTRLGVVPGDPAASQLFFRMGASGANKLLHMPPVCTKVVDYAALHTVYSWIMGLPH
jgi:hypothetical protein